MRHISASSIGQAVPRVVRLALGALLVAFFGLATSEGAAAWPCQIGVVSVAQVAPNTYGFVLGATGGAYTGDVALNLYTKTARYPLDVPAVPITASNGVTDQIGIVLGHRSAPYYVTLPGQDPLEAVTVAQGQDQSGNPCDLRPYLLPAAHPDSYPYIDGRSVNGLANEIKTKYVATATPLSPKAPETLGAPACKEPYRGARTTRPVIPQPPSASRFVDATGQEQNVNGDVTAIVELDSGGNDLAIGIYHSSGSPLLDGATKTAASTSEYSAELFRCEPVAGPYLFRASF